jgi:hypothetical protein
MGIITLFVKVHSAFVPEIQNFLYLFLMQFSKTLMKVSF